MRYSKLLLILLGSCQTLLAQKSFPEKCIGTWQGTMYIYGYGHLKDSVSVKLTVAPTKEANVWTWKTDYLSPKMPMTKDYLLKLSDKEKNLYLTDEGNNLTLNSYLVGNKLYDVFETHEILLTSTYELRGDELIFEVTSGKKLPATHPEVNNFSVSSLQRVVFKRNK